MTNNNRFEPATKADLSEVENRLNRKIDSVEKGLNDKIDSVESGLNGKIQNVYFEVVKLQSRVINIEEKMATKDDVNRILVAVDKFAGMADNYDPLGVPSQ